MHYIFSDHSTTIKLKFGNKLKKNCVALYEIYTHQNRTKFVDCDSQLGDVKLANMLRDKF